MPTRLYDFGTPLATKFKHVTLNLTSRPIYKSGYLLEWRYFIDRAPRRPCPTTATILRKDGLEWRQIHSDVLTASSLNSGINRQEVKNAIVRVKTNDVVNIHYKTEYCDGPVLSASFEMSEIPANMPDDDHVTIEKTVYASINIIILEYKRVGSRPSIYYLSPTDIQIGWIYKHDSSIDLHGFQVVLSSSTHQVVSNRTVNNNTAVFNNLKHDEIYYATVQIIQKMWQQYAIDELVSLPSPLFCTERRKLDKCSLRIKEIEQHPHSQNVLEIKYPEGIDSKCVTKWFIAYWPSEKENKTVTEDAEIKKSIRIVVDSRLTYIIALYVRAVYNRSTELCRVDLKYPDHPGLRLRLICLHSPILSWGISTNDLKQGVEYLVKCYSNEKLLLNMEASENSVFINDAQPDVIYECSVQAKLKLFTNIASNSFIRFQLGIIQLQKIEAVFERPGFVVLYFEESVIMKHSETVSDIQYKIYCEPFYYAEGRYSPLILKDVPDEKVYNCSIILVDRCGMISQTSNFGFTTIGNKPSKISMAHILVCAFLLITGIIAGFLANYKHRSKVESKLSLAPLSDSRYSSECSSIYNHNSCYVELPYYTADAYNGADVRQNKRPNRKRAKRKRKRRE